MTQQWTQRIPARCVGLGRCLLAGLLMGCAPQPPQVPVEERVATRLQLGMAYLARDDLEAARRHLENALALAPDDYRTHMGMALYEQRLGQYGAAEQRYQRVLRQRPENGSVMNNYGAFLCGLGQYVAAQQQFNAAAQLSDYRQVAQALENAGYCYLRAGDDGKARELLVRTLKNEPAKGDRLLAEVEQQLAAQQGDKARQLLDIYRHSLSDSAESLWLEIRFAALAGHDDKIDYYGNRLARSFPQSKQYQQFLANEY